MPRDEPMSRTRVLCTVGLAAAGISAGLMISFPWYVEAPLTVEPIDVVDVYNEYPGELLEIRVEPGDYVQKGDPIIVLSARDQEQHLRELEREWQTEDIRSSVHRRLQEEELLAISRQRLRAIEDQIADAKQVAEAAVVRAAMNGRIVAPPRVRPASLEQQFEKLPRWSGIPLENAVLGAYIDARTHVCSIAPTDDF